MRKIVCIIVCAIAACLGLQSQSPFGVCEDVTIVSYPIALPQKYQELIKHTVAFYLKMEIASYDEIRHPLVLLHISESKGRKMIYLSEHRKEDMEYCRYYCKFGYYTVYSSDSIWENFRCEGDVDTLSFRRKIGIYDPPEWLVEETDSTFEVRFSPVDLPSYSIKIDNTRHMD